MTWGVGLLDGFRRHQNRRDTVEADAQVLMVEPALVALGLPGSVSPPRAQAGPNTPGEICYTSERLDESGYAALVAGAAARIPGAFSGRASVGVECGAPHSSG